MNSASNGKSTGHKARDEVMIRFLREELVGPCPGEKPLDCARDLVFSSPEEASGNWKQMDSGDEILKILPSTRYGVGVLYPVGVLSETSDPDTDSEHEITGSESTEIEDPDREETEVREARSSTGADDDEFDVSTANARFPSSMAISFFCDLKPSDSFSVRITGGVYGKREVRVGQKVRGWWLRRALERTVAIDVDPILEDGGVFEYPIDTSELQASPELRLMIKGYARRLDLQGQGEGLLITLALVNGSLSANHSQSSGLCLFQAGLSATLLSGNGSPLIKPYPEVASANEDEERDSNRLLYRNDQVFAVGHGCAANWDALPGEGRQTVSMVSAEVLPEYEVPSITPDIRLPDGRELAVSMQALGEYEPDSEGGRQLGQLIDAYDHWIQGCKTRLSGLEKAEWAASGHRHIRACELALDRIRQGKRLLDDDSDVRKAFCLMNQAMLLQQEHAPRQLREPVLDEWGRHSYSHSPWRANDVKGTWRAFQIGFIMMALNSVADEQDPMHEAVELIWFPTGGGKTEAYLGLAAFSMIYNRMVHDGAEAENCQVLMRYTLRLLTAQQLQRAATLICALETLRRADPQMGETPFRVGLWVGRSSTPNTREQALKALGSMERRSAPNQFLLTRCPWCGAAMGPAGSTGKREQFIGYERRNGTVEFCCPDNGCAFSRGLPVTIIDEDIYESPPSLLIGTVDKFALLPWKSEIRSIFGVDDRGERAFKPPSLIIQDELHLISGPLGSMVGLYEPLIEELCTERRHGKMIRPKIISATATTSRYGEQIRKLYGRSQSSLFPPPGLEAADSFFARYATDADGTLSPGRRYMGVYAPGLGSMMTAQVRTFSALMAGPSELEINARDPWQTLLVFYNSLRELGGGLTLFQSDIPGYLGEVWKRLPGLAPHRYIDRVEELTSRLSAEEIPQAIDKLMYPYPVLTDEQLAAAIASVRPLASLNPEISVLLQQLDSSRDQQLKAIYLLNRAIGLIRKGGEGLSEEMQRVQAAVKGKGVTDVCLASNIIEVGVDIDRLGMMAIVGQPKTTAQYIQVSGRVGRQWTRSPGLVVTLYSTAKPRDRSHFEHFRGYHQQLYAQVEPSSVTPWSDPALDRALHGLLFGFMRQLSPAGCQPDEVSDAVVERCWDSLSSLRGEFMTETERERAHQRFMEIRQRLGQRQPTLWGDFFKRESGRDLMFPMGEPVDRAYGRTTFPVPTSMRFVDGESEVRIENPYAVDEERF